MFLLLPVQDRHAITAGLLTIHANYGCQILHAEMVGGSVKGTGAKLTLWVYREFTFGNLL